MAKQRHYVGIDLGTTFSTLAYVDEAGTVDALRLPDGGCAMASAIYFRSPTDIVVGSEAIRYAVVDPTRIAQEFKREIGNADYSFQVDGKGYRPEELSAIIVKKLLDCAAAQLGPIESAVISVPFVFDEKCRRATQNAGYIAGLKEVDLVEEPVAAAVAYGHTLMTGGGFSSIDNVFLDETVLVYDLGGGTFDATVMSLHAEKKGKFTVLATDGDYRLGGKDWDRALEELLYEKLKAMTGTHPQYANDLGYLQDIRLKAIEAKTALSERNRTNVVIHFKDKDYTIPLPRGEFEAATTGLLRRSELTLTEMMTKNQLSWGSVDRILLVGGSSRMPMVANMIQRVSKRTLDRSLPPDVAIAKGAALYAARNSPATNIDVKTVNSHALGLIVNHVKTNTLMNRVILKANQPTRSRVTRAFKVKEGQRKISLPILLGEHKNPEMCARLGMLSIADLPKDLPKDANVEVGFTFQDNGLLQIEVQIFKEPNKPIGHNFELMVEGVMTEEEVQSATETLRGIKFDE